MDIIFLIYFSKSFDRLGKENGTLYLLCVSMSCNCVDLIIGGLKDHFGVPRDVLLAVSILFWSCMLVKCYYDVRDFSETLNSGHCKVT